MICTKTQALVSLSEEPDDSNHLINMEFKFILFRNHKDTDIQSLSSFSKYKPDGLRAAHLKNIKETLQACLLRCLCEHLCLKGIYHLTVEIISLSALRICKMCPLC